MDGEIEKPIEPMKAEPMMAQKPAIKSHTFLGHTVEFNPKQSLFGKESYVREQLHLESFAMSVDSAIAMVEPLAVAFPIPTERFHFSYRLRQVKKNLERARKSLEDVGLM